MRLAALLGRTVAELHETMDAVEWNKWHRFHSLYDLPDAFLVAEVLGQLIRGVVGGKGQMGDFAPYYKSDGKIPSQPKNDLKPAYDFIAAYAKERNLPKTRAR